MATERLTSILNHLTPSTSGLSAITQKNSDDVVITHAIRTPLTKAFKGGFKDTPLDFIIYSLLKEVIKRSTLDPQYVEDICLGNVSEQRAAYFVRAASLAAGFPNTTAASSVNRFCSSGLKAVQDIANQISLGHIECGIAIGAELMSGIAGSGIDTFHDEIVKNAEARDCLQPMGQTSENVGNDFNISREEQDRFAAESFQRAERAQKAGWFDDEIVPIVTSIIDPKTGEERQVTLTKDEGPRHGTTFESLSKIRPAFPEFGNKSTGGNSSQVTDGAAAVVMMKRSKAIALNQPILAKFCGATVSGVAPRIMGIGPSIAIPKLLSKFNLNLDTDIDVIEINEAFASMAVYCTKVLNVNPAKMNIRGGAIALGHPLGATGTRQICTGLSECRRQKKKVLLTSELRSLNARAWAGEKGIFAINPTLDSSLKKNTAFIKRIRTAITTSSAPTFLQEIRSLSLQKYLSEIISASYEGLCKLKTPGEISAGVEIISALHQRFGTYEFTTYLGWLLGRGLSTPEKAHLKALGQDAKEKEERERLIRQRTLMKVVTELWLVGVLRSLDDAARPEDTSARGKDGSTVATSRLGEAAAKSKPGQGIVKMDQAVDAEPFPLEVLKDLLGHDKEHLNLPLVVHFVKNFGWDVLGISSSFGERRKHVEPNGIVAANSEAGSQSSAEEDSVATTAVEDAPFTSPELQQRFRNVLDRYFEDLKCHIVRDQKAITAQARRNAEAYVKSGEVFEDRQANHEKQLKAQEKLLADAQILCDALEGQEMPDLKEKDAQDFTGTVGIGLVKTGEYLRGQAEGAGIWQDEEERRFYENLIDLFDRVPGILLADPKKKKAEGDEPVGRRFEAASISTNDATETSEKASLGPSAEDQSITIVNKTVGAQVDALLARLPELQNKEMVDQTAIDFCFLNSKASRNRLGKALQDVPKGRSDLLPFYSRLIATLGKYMPDMIQGVVSYLDDEFRSLQRRKQKDFLGQVRTGNIRYLAELTKFGVVPEHVIFHCLKVSLDDFSRMNIEIISNLLENCGRYLLRNPDTSPRMSSFLETLQRKKSAQHIGQQERMLIENAMYTVNPPERAAIQQKERTPVELYVHKLVYLDMNKRTYTKVLKSLRKLHWEEREVVDLMEKVLSKPGKAKYSNIHLLAVLVGSLYRYHQDFVIMVIDNVLEQITVGLERNEFKLNQRRIAEVKYLGELYNYKMVDSPVIFDTLYRIVTFGHVGGIPTRERLNPLDMPDDFFRIRLVCNLIDTCGVCFDRGMAKKKLDFFLTFFQYYIHTKDTLPMDIEFIVQDTFALTRSNWKLAASFEEAWQAFAELTKGQYKTQEADKNVELEAQEDDSLSEEDGEDDDLPVPDIDDTRSSSDEVDIEPTAYGNLKPGSDFDEDIIVTRQLEERDPEAEAEFDRELAKMMSESLDSRKFERKPVFDVPLPMRRSQRDATVAGDESPPETTSTPPNTMAFSLMTKKGNKQQTRSIELPSDSNFAVAMKLQKEAERAERQNIKNLVLNYDMHDSGIDLAGTTHQIYLDPFLQPNPNIRTPARSRSVAHNALHQGSSGEKHGSPHHSHAPSLHQTSSKSGSEPRAAEKSATNRGGHRARKLQLSDVDWYETKSGSSHKDDSLRTRQKIAG